MNAVTPAFLDISTLQFCPRPQLVQLVAVKGFDFLVGEEVIHAVRGLDCAGWIADHLAQGRVSPHRIIHLDDISLVSKLMKRCGVCRGEACSYVAAKRENGIVVAQDRRAHEMLTCHISGVMSVEPEEFLRGNGVVDKDDRIAA